ncbi:MAG: type II toxin-antitoxin system RelE/ParE family toxin [Zoogloeaceae bacterium]|jgi:putative addiction module killer protein|nr:type II toxin-antitoxin system RelE/ParE family toxin [Zoogloeaceae bacterium]
MYEVIKSNRFNIWLENLRDRVAAARITARIRLAEQGNLGDWKALRDGISEMRVNVGAGYRIYFTRHGQNFIVLLVGGDKRSQAKDIQQAIELAEQWKDENHEDDPKGV